MPRGDNLTHEMRVRGGIARRNSGCDYSALGRKGGIARRNSGCDYSELGKRGFERTRDKSPFFFRDHLPGIIKAFNAKKKGRGRI